MAEVTSPWQLDSLTGEDPPKDWMLAANVQRSYAEVGIPESWNGTATHGVNIWKSTRNQGKKS